MGMTNVRPRMYPKTLKGVRLYRFVRSWTYPLDIDDTTQGIMLKFTSKKDVLHGADLNVLSKRLLKLHKTLSSSCTSGTFFNFYEKGE